MQKRIFFLKKKKKHCFSEKGFKLFNRGEGVLFFLGGNQYLIVERSCFIKMYLGRNRRKGLLKVIVLFGLFCRKE